MYDEVYRTQHGFTMPMEHTPSDIDMEQYARGDLEIIPKLIEGLTAFIVNEVDWFLNCTPSARPYKEDCISEALVSLTDFVNKQSGNELFTPSRFIACAKAHCINQIKDWLRDMSIAVTIPSRSQRRGVLGTNLNQCKLGADIKCTGKEDIFDEVWFQCVMDTLDERDEKIVRYKIQGMSNREIGRELGMNHQLVDLRLSYLHDLFDGKVQ